MKTKYIFLVVLFLLTFAPACLDDIELDIPKGFRKTIIIDGKIVKGPPSTLELRVSQLFSFTIESRGRISTKDAILMDESGNEMVIKPRGQGLYLYTFKETDPIAIEFGKSYKVRLETFDGRIFESSFESMPPPTRVETLKAENVEKEFIFIPDQTKKTEPVIRYTLNTNLTPPDLDEKLYLRWDIQQIAKVTDSPIDGSDPKVCYVTNKLDIVTTRIFNGPAQKANTLDDYVIFDAPITTYYGEGLFLEVIQESLSKSAFEYWETVKLSYEREGNIFADPAGKLKSNFANIDDPNDETFGFFYITQQDTARVYASPELAGNPKTRCPSPRLICPGGSRCCDPLCCDCATAPNEITTMIKPYYWID